MKIYYCGDHLSKKIGIYKITFYTEIGEYTYIGQTKDNFSHRWSHHCYSFENNTCNRRIRWVLKGRKRNIKIVFEILEECEWYECNDLEKYYIQKYHPELNIQLKKIISS
jgi:excinuclease UvrABC nuclease subunit